MNGESFIPSSLSEITCCKCKKGSYDNRKCKFVNVGFLFFDIYITVQTVKVITESDDEDTSDIEIEFSDSNSDLSELNDPSTLPDRFA